MIAVIDNGSGAENIARSLRNEAEVIKPKDAIKSKASAFILSDGDNKTIEKNAEFLEKVESPVLAIGMSSIFLGALFGASVKKIKPVKNERISIKKSCPLTLDLKKTAAVVKKSGYGLENVPENFVTIGSSKNCDYEILQDQGSPLFLVNFNPEDGGDGITILRNFEKFVIEVWENYHK